MKTRHRLLRRLADGGVHSGQALAGQLGVSRAAVWKQIRGLSDLGLTITARRGTGYQLSASVELLDPDVILSELTPNTQRLLSRIEIRLQVDSTRLTDR